MCKLIKSFLLPVLAAMVMPAYGAEEFRAELTANPVEFPAGSETMVSITLNRGDLAGGIRLPAVEGVTWHTNHTSVSRSSRVVNGRRSESVTYSLPLTATRPGEVNIPEMEFKLADGTTAKSNSLRLKVLSPGKAPAATDGAAAVSGSGEPEGIIEVPPKSRRESYYVGEEIPLELTLLIPPAARVRGISFPDLKAEGQVVFPDYSQLNPRHPHFAPPREGVRMTPGGRLQAVAFDTRLRFLSPGDFRVSATERVDVSAVRGRRGAGASPFGDDGFFGGSLFEEFFGGGDVRQVTVSYPSLALRILPLPPAPADAEYLNLVGDWRLSAALSTHSARVGEPVELTVGISGSGTGDGLTPPKLELPGFRVYPPEVKREPDGSRSIRYALIPLRPGEHELSPAFSVFDPVSGEYRTLREKFTLAVSGGTNSAAAPPPAGAPAPEPAAGETEPAEREELFYQKPDSGGAVLLPLIRNSGIAALGTFILLALGAAVWEISARRQEKLAADPESSGRRLRKRKLSALLRQLKSGESAAAVLREGGLEFLAAGVGLPPGSTAQEVAEKTADPELREFLAGMDRDAFAPNGTASEQELSPASRRRLIKALRRTLMLFAAMLPLPAVNAGGYNAAFDRGDYAAAAEQYLREAAGQSGKIYPAGCYNAGCAYFKAGDAPRARLWLERAHLLAPRDFEATENLNLVNRSLLLPEVNPTGTPGELLLYCRDRMRPDEYAALALVLAGAALLLFASRRRWRSGACWTAAAAATAALLALWAMGSQLAGPYRSSRAIVTAATLELRTLPVENSGRVEAQIPGGGDATILEERGEWLRLAVNGRDGWVKRDTVERVFPYRCF